MIIDTNVSVSGLIKSDDAPVKILNLILVGSITLCIDSRILGEYKNVLYRDKFSFPKISSMVLSIILNLLQ